MGLNTLYNNTTGSCNVALGFCSMFQSTTGCLNTAVGWKSMCNITTGFQNVAVGTCALHNISTNNCNTALGYIALRLNSSGYGNTTVGRNSLSVNTSGFHNTALGTNAGTIVTTGSNLTALGYNAQPSSASATNEITLGDANVDTIRFGNGNLLPDDYEEGTWTPEFRGTSGSAGSSSTSGTGTYVKIGKLVFLRGSFLRWSDIGSYSGDVQLFGLPFTASGSDGSKTAGSVCWVKRVEFPSNAYNPPGITVENGQNYIEFMKQQSDLATAFELTTVQFDDPLNSLHITCMYETDA